MKTIYFACFGLLLLHQYIVPASACSCKRKTPLKEIYQIVPHFKEVHGCGRIFTTSYGVSKRGVRRISYRTELKKNESAIDVCDCIHGYLSQKSFIDGSIQSCCVRKNIATMTVEGKPDPTFNRKTDENSNSVNVLQQLAEIFDQFPNAEVANHHCRTGTRRNESGDIHFDIQCDLRPDSPCKNVLCKKILRYLNQDNWLGELTSKCSSVGKVLYMEVLRK